MASGERITTGGGDRGETCLGDGTRVAKTAARIAACGTVDELNSLLGLARCEALPEGLDAELEALQRELFVLGADLVTPGADTGDDLPGRRITAAAVARLEALIAAAEQGLPPLTAFILPGGGRTAALLHLARAVARRAEREALAALGVPAEGDAPPRPALVYLNRLSDLLFLLARRAAAGHGGDHPWRPTPGA